MQSTKVFHITLGLVSASIACVIGVDGGRFGWASTGFGLFAVWQMHCSSGNRRRPKPVLRLGGFEWDLHAFCRGWLITGQTGSGKTLAAINRMLWDVSTNCPTWGGVCVDDKGVYWETLSAMLRNLGREDDLILLQVRPEGAASDWQPAHRFNVLENPYLPYSAKAKMICDVAAAVGQRTEQSFFKMHAQVQMEFAFRALHCTSLAVTLEHAYEFLTSEKLMGEIMAIVAQQETPEARALIEH